MNSGLVPIASQIARHSGRWNANRQKEELTRAEAAPPSPSESQWWSAAVHGRRFAVKQSTMPTYTKRRLPGNRCAQGHNGARRALRGFAGASLAQAVLRVRSFRTPAVENVLRFASRCLL